jgi:zinc protease
LKGEGSRLYNKLVKKERMTLHISGGIEIRKNISSFKAFVLSNNELLARESQKTILSEINRIKSNLLSKDELKRAKNIFKMDYLNQYSTSLKKALFLIEVFLYKGDFDHLKDELDKYLAVSNYDIIKILNRYFINKSIILNINMK